MSKTIDEKQMTLGHDWDGYSDVLGWIVSEKHDGCRAFWDGKTLWSRSGRKIDAPASFVSQLPSGVCLDGELWCGRGEFDAASNAVRLSGKHWSDGVRFVVFDVPSASGSWDSRMKHAAKILDGCRVARPVEILGRVDGLQSLRKTLSAIKRAGGEGLMLRNPKTDGYEMGRTKNLLKVKSWPR